MRVNIDYYIIKHLPRNFRDVFFHLNDMTNVSSRDEKTVSELISK